MSETRRQLENLARLYGVELSFHDIRGREYVASDEALLALLPRLGAQLQRPSDAPEALRLRRRQLAERVLQPAMVAWEGEPATTLVRLPRQRLQGRWRLEVRCEGGEEAHAEGQLEHAEIAEETDLEGTRYAAARLPLPGPLPLGYHRAILEAAGERHEALLICAPVRAWLPERQRLWGLFAPTYALWREQGLGGSLRELGDLVRLTGELGGQVVGTLPLMAAFLDEPFEPSPYAPVSRLFWNELFIDLEALPELDRAEEARSRLASVDFGKEVSALAAEPLVDYRRQMALKRSVLEPLARAAFASDSPTRGELERWADAHPHAKPYARFRAVTERQRKGWPAWPEALQRGQVTAADYADEVYRYHLYVQWRMTQQVEALSNEARGLGGGLYLDLPVGVHPDGYDAWHERDAFLDGCSAGAPPDDLFTGGQDWGFRPLHPENIRTRGYRYVIACIRHQLQSAAALRIDHVMGLHRIYCVPWGLGAKQGVYVHFAAEELYAILLLESQRRKSFLVGEDLGTVPDAVRHAMNRHGLQRMYVGQFELRHDHHRAIMPVPEPAIASMNTHDTPTFAAFWEGKDIEDRLRLGHLSPEEAGHERGSRGALRDSVSAFLRGRGAVGDQASTAEVYAAILRFLAESEGKMALVNLEDLWGETIPQNVPGTTHEHPNWRRKAAHPSDALRQVPGLMTLLGAVARLRRR